MATYQSRIGRGLLQEGDKVIFVVNGNRDEYEVHSSFLYLNATTNSKIFTQLGLDPYKFASESYGYEVDSGDWPWAKEGDYAALTRLVNALFDECDKANKAPSLLEAAERMRSLAADSVNPNLWDSNPYRQCYTIDSKGNKDYGWYQISPDGLMLSTFSKPKKSFMTRISNMMKKFLDAKTQTLIKAGYLTSELDVTSCGQEALNSLLFQDKIDALTALAQEKLDAEAKEKC